MSSKRKKPRNVLEEVGLVSMTEKEALDLIKQMRAEGTLPSPERVFAAMQEISEELQSARRAATEGKHVEETGTSDSSRSVPSEQANQNNQEGDE